MKTYPAVVLSGYSPDNPDPLAVAMGVERKALVDIAGRPMVYWIVKALHDSERVGRIAVVGLKAEDEIDFGVDVLRVPNHPGQFDNVLAGISALQAEDPTVEHVIVASGDIPLLTPPAVDWLVTACERLNADFIYSLVEQKVMEGQYPGSARSYVPLREGRFCGGDLHFVRASVARNNEQLVRDLLTRRKNAFKQVRLAGFGTLFKLLIHRLTLRDAERAGARLMHCDTRTLISPFADLGMDVDKPHQLELARRILGAAA